MTEGVERSESRRVDGDGERKEADGKSPEMDGESMEVERRAGEDRPSGSRGEGIQVMGSAGRRGDAERQARRLGAAMGGAASRQLREVR